MRRGDFFIVTFVESMNEVIFMWISEAFVLIHVSMKFWFLKTYAGNKQIRQL